MRAARLGDHIGHTHPLGGLITGAVVGAGLVIGGAIIVGTGGAALAVVAGAALLAGATGAWIGEFVGSLSSSGTIARIGVRSLIGGLAAALPFGPALGGAMLTGGGRLAEYAGSLLGLSDFTGVIDSGSPDVFINDQKAARVDVDTAPCAKYPPVVALIAIGSRNVFINDHHAARIDDKLSCGAIIKEGSKNVHIGGEQVQVLTVKEDKDEVPDWMRWAVFGAGVGGALLMGGFAAAPTLILAGGLGWIGSDVLGQLGQYLGRNYGEWLSEDLGWLPSDWEKIGTFSGEGIGGFIGGWLGVKGARITDLIKFDRNTIFSIGGVPPLPPQRPRRPLRLGEGVRKRRRGSNLPYYPLPPYRSRRGPRHGDEGEGQPPVPKVNSPNGLRAAAKTVHRRIRVGPFDRRAMKGSAVAIARITLKGGSITYYASGNQGKLTPHQIQMLEKAGVPRENILSRGKAHQRPEPKRSDYKSEDEYLTARKQWNEDHHAERVILKNLPPGAKVEEWGISYGGKQSPHPCLICGFYVNLAGGRIQE
jgi:uncharacterized Zn-binding protein involved in type VI secretion